MRRESPSLLRHMQLTPSHIAPALAVAVLRKPPALDFQLALPLRKALLLLRNASFLVACILAGTALVATVIATVGTSAIAVLFAKLATAIATVLLLLLLLLLWLP
jgi:hypothetical protein